MKLLGETILAILHILIEAGGLLFIIFWLLLCWGFFFVGR
jgi:hypothetical protein